MVSLDSGRMEQADDMTIKHAAKKRALVDEKTEIITESLYCGRWAANSSSVKPLKKSGFSEAKAKADELLTYSTRERSDAKSQLKALWRRVGQRKFASANLWRRARSARPT